MEIERTFLNFLIAGSSPATKNNLISLYKNHFEKEVGIYVSPGELVECWNERKLSPATISKLLVIYVSWYKFTYNQVPDLRIIRRKVNRLIPKEAKPGWNIEQSRIALFVAYHFNRRLYEMMLVTLHTGVTKSEIFGLQIEDLDFKNRLIKVHRSKVGRTRWIPMSNSVYDLFQEKKFDLLTLQFSKFSRIFDWFEVNYPLKRICQMANVPILSWHGLRATFATIALEGGESPRKVAEVLGHKNIITTFRYWRMTPGEINFEKLP